MVASLRTQSRRGSKCQLKPKPVHNGSTDVLFAVLFDPAACYLRAGASGCQLVLQPHHPLHMAHVQLFIVIVEQQLQNNETRSLLPGSEFDNAARMG